jgi:hypothetical protein
MALGYSRQIFEEYSNAKFRDKPFLGAELLHADKKTDGQTDITKLIVAFRNFARAHNNLSYKVGNTLLIDMLSSYPSTLGNSGVYPFSNVTLPAWIRV